MGANRWDNAHIVSTNTARITYCSLSTRSQIIAEQSSNPQTILMKIIAIRHGITDDNKKGVLQGQRLNLGMNEEGINQVKSGLGQLDTTNLPEFSHIYTSPLLRTRQTADLIKDMLNLKIIERDELMERDFGTLSGQKWEDIAQEHGEELKQIDKALEYNYQPFGGESVQQVRERVTRFLDSIKSEPPVEAVLLATHGGTLRIFYDVLGLEQPAHIKNGSIHTFEI